MKINVGDIVIHKNNQLVGRACRETSYFWYVRFKDNLIGCRLAKKTSLVKAEDQSQSVPGCDNCG